ncbi:MAG: hypothetical protein V7711_06625 [Pseudomonadales bacterium]
MNSSIIVSSVSRVFGKGILLAATLVALQSSMIVISDQAGVSLDTGKAYAADKKPKDTRPTRKTPALRNNVYEKLSEAQLLAEEKKFPQALKVLDSLRNTEGKKALNGYELANMWNFYAFVYYSQENYPKVIDAYKKVLVQKDIPLAMEDATKFQLAQLYFVTENYPAAVKALEDWFTTAPNPMPDQYVLLAQAKFQTKDYNGALRDIEKAMALAVEKGKEPKENWYLLMRALYYEKGDMAKVAEVLEELLRKWPKKDYWMQLSGMYGELKQDSKQLAAYETAYRTTGFDREQEMINMAYLYLGGETPYKAARVLEKGIESKVVKETTRNYEVLGSAYSSANEAKRALPYMEKAAKLSKIGEPWARLANIYFDNDKHKEAVDAGKKALKMGKVKRPDNTRIVVGMSLFNLDRLSEARKMFVVAAKDKRSKKTANQWIKYLDKEIIRREAMKDGLS